jgi:hypothetical protein
MILTCERLSKAILFSFFCRLDQWQSKDHFRCDKTISVIVCVLVRQFKTMSIAMDIRLKRSSKIYCQGVSTHLDETDLLFV